MPFGGIYFSLSEDNLIYLMEKILCWKYLKRCTGRCLYWLANGNEKQQVFLQATGRVLSHSGPHPYFEQCSLKEISMHRSTVCTKLILWEYIWFWWQNTEYIIQASTTLPSKQACPFSHIGSCTPHPGVPDGVLSWGAACTHVLAQGWRGRWVFAVAPFLLLSMWA